MSIIGWFPSLATAETYFATERVDATSWNNLTVTSTSDKKTACLKQAFNRIFYSRDFIVPAYADATAAQLVVLQKAQAEMAYYLAQHLRDEDRRKGLIAQGVSEAGIVKEVYRDAAADEAPIPAFVRDLLVGFWAGEGSGFEVGGVERDEDDEEATF
jgi:hypothetical protein